FVNDVTHRQVVGRTDHSSGSVREIPPRTLIRPPPPPNDPLPQDAVGADSRWAVTAVHIQGGRRNMRINQNIAAFNAYRNLSSTNVVMGKSLDKLSSAFRINRAADDAAGLVTSQGLRAQVSGLRQATRNAQDGISVVQTAEGALNEVHNMLNRMRDLAVQSANSGSNDATARSAAQAEIVALTAEIDRIASSTQF